MTVCPECGGALDPDTIHVHHAWDCWDPEWCGCEETCAACCTHPDCPLREAAT